MKDPVTAYAQSVIAGEVPACELVRLACERHMRDLDGGVWVWDLDAAMVAINFFPLLRHYEGPYAGKPFVLNPWQEFLVGSIFGWKDAAGLRRFREAWVEIPRKNGKSMMAGGVALLMFMLETGAEVYAVATKEDQAKIVWNYARVMLKHAPSLKKRVRILQKSMHFDMAEGVFKPLGRDSETLDGLNPSAAVGDELHAWKSREMYDVIDDGFGSRDQPLFFLITTAGPDKEKFGYQHRVHAVNVVKGGKQDYQDERLFVFICTIDEGDDPFDEATWYKANPNLGTGKGLEYMRLQAQRAQLIPSKKAAFFNKQLNIWGGDVGNWIDPARWDACRMDPDWDDFAGARCYVGLDLASTTDVAAAVCIFPLEGGGYLVKPRFWLPEKAIKDNRRQRDKATLDKLRRWAEEGYIEQTPGDWIDYDIIRARILEDAGRFKIEQLGFDPWNAGNLPNELEREGVKVVQVRQVISTLCAPTREFERLILAGQLGHDGNPVLAWMVSNAVLHNDSNDNIRPDKKKSHEKIDGVMATISGLLLAMGQEEEKASIYEEQEIRTV